MQNLVRIDRATTDLRMRKTCTVSCGFFKLTYPSICPFLPRGYRSQLGGAILTLGGSNYVFLQPLVPVGGLITARCYAGVLAMGLCLSMSLSVCLSEVGVLLKQLNVGSQKQHHTIAQGV